MTREKEENLITQVGEMHAILFKNGLVKRMMTLEKTLSNAFRANVILLVLISTTIIALISLITKLAGLW